MASPYKTDHVPWSQQLFCLIILNWIGKKRLEWHSDNCWLKRSNDVGVKGIKNDSLMDQITFIDRDIILGITDCCMVEWIFFPDSIFIVNHFQLHSNICPFEIYATEWKYLWWLFLRKKKYQSLIKERKEFQVYMTSRILTSFLFIYMRCKVARVEILASLYNPLIKKETKSFKVLIM